MIVKDKRSYSLILNCHTESSWTKKLMLNTYRISFCNIFLLRKILINDIHSTVDSANVNVYCTAPVSRKQKNKDRSPAHRTA
ncbi:hypothetical protein DSUL_50048 [Desulfovibrionales bacterium]